MIVFVRMSMLMILLSILLCLSGCGRCSKLGDAVLKAGITSGCSWGWAGKRRKGWVGRVCSGTGIRIGGGIDWGTCSRQLYRCLACSCCTMIYLFWSSNSTDTRIPE